MKKTKPNNSQTFKGRIQNNKANKQNSMKFKKSKIIMKAINMMKNFKNLSEILAITSISASKFQTSTINPVHHHKKKGSKA
jgi:hypothetical protein